MYTAHVSSLYWAPFSAPSRTGRSSPPWPKGPHGRLAPLFLSISTPHRHFDSAHCAPHKPQNPPLPEAARRRGAEKALSGNWVALPPFAGHGVRNVPGVVVRPGETVKCDPGDFFCHISQIALQAGKGNEDVRIFMKVDGREFFIATLSDDKYPHHKTDLYLEEEFELLHSSKTRSISVIGNNFSNLEIKSDTSSEQGPTAIQSSTLEETMDPGKLQTDVGASDDDDSDEDYVDSEEGETSDDEDFSDEDASESSNEDDDEDSSKSAKDKNRPAEKTLKTPPEKKAKMTTPSKGSGTGMRSGYVHVATPYPSKLVKKTPSIVEKPKQPTGYACNSCSRSFNSYIALKTHCKVKKHKRSPHMS
ncbi:histone deacetylase HDT3-like [Miscanthus floridulus]|uniref:histone deacetylase HDT3-like n=1 Tax=Miscanthus floridulus TaxID=154761 RepID=UPI00345754E7